MPTVLIVDDEAENLRSLKRYLEEKNPTWTVTTARSEEEAEAALRDKELDVVVSDLVMANEQAGIEILRMAKERDPLIMVILITAFEKKLDRYRAFELGAFDCVQKNMPGVIAAEEILVKAKAALRFRQLALDQMEQGRRVALLKRYFDQGVFGAIEANPALLAIRLQTVSICFWDIRGFSALCETLKAYPTLIAGFLRDYFQTAAEVLFEHQGVLDKFIGDGVMGLFGALERHGDDGREDAVRAVKAAGVLRDRFASVLEKWLKEWTLYTPQKIDIGIGCGVHTGEVLVGNVGTDSRDQFTALGPHVNFAQRLEARAPAGQILVSASTEARVRDLFALEDAGTIKDIKNIAGEFRVFAVQHPK